MKNPPFSQMHYHTLPVSLSHYSIALSPAYCSYSPLCLHYFSSLRQFSPPHLRLDVGVVVVLEQQRGRLGVVFAGGDVQGREADLTLGVVLQQQGDHRVVALLESDGQRSEAVLEEAEKKQPRINEHNQFRDKQRKKRRYSYLCCNALVPFVFQHVSHHLQVVLLGCHVERSEAILWRQMHTARNCTRM